MVKRLGLRKHSSSSFQKYPPLRAAEVWIQLPIGQGAYNKGERSTVQMSPCENFPDPSLPIERAN